MSPHNEQKIHWREMPALARDVWHEFISDNGILAAAGVAFYLTLSLIPLLLLLLSVAAFFVTPAQVSTIATSLSASFGAGVGDAIRTQILSVVQNRGVLTGISLLVGLWAGSQIFVIIQTALNLMWAVEDHRSFWVRRGLALLMVLLTGVLVAIAVGLTYLVRVLGEFNIPLFGRTMKEIPWFLTAVVNIILPFLLIITAFALIYRYLPAKKIPWAAVLPGAILAGLLWVLVLQAFSWYTDNFANYAVLYGSLGGLILLLLWFNYSAQILLLGAETSSVVHRRKKQADQAKET